MNLRLRNSPAYLASSVAGCGLPPPGTTHRDARQAGDGRSSGRVLLNLEDFVGKFGHFFVDHVAELVLKGIFVTI